MGFVASDSLEVDEWRSIIPFGRNVATYKFALARSLVELGRNEKDLVTLEELAHPFSRHLCRHLEQVDTQGTFGRSRFLDACRFYNAGSIDEDELITVTTLLGFVNVIDAFHRLKDADAETRFFIDERAATGGIRLTDELIELATAPQSESYLAEVESRWNLVESAWHAKRNGEPLMVLYDSPKEILVPALLGRRRSITEVRPALNGYQKGHCFYCYRAIRIVPSSDLPADVDHFFPHVLMSHGLPVDLDAVWNLVLACRDCNRGVNGKMHSVPNRPYLEDLRLRNEFLIWSHHPLRDTLIALTGRNSNSRRAFLHRIWDWADDLGARTDWRPLDVGSPLY